MKQLLNQSFANTVLKQRLDAKQLRTYFSEQFNDSNAPLISKAPGRINLIGDHTDYNMGLVLPITLNRAVWMAAKIRHDDQVNIYSVDFDQKICYTLDQRPEFEPDSWTACVSGVLEECRLSGYLHQGINAVIVGDVPLGSGLSSSAATEIVTGLTIEHLFKSLIDPVWMIKMSQQVEHKYIGVNCGIMDQFVSRLGQHAHALLLDCNDLSFQHIPIDLGKVAILYAHSGVPRQLANSAYNDRRQDCLHGVEYFQNSDPSIASLRDISLEKLYSKKAELPDQVFRRCHHVISENKRVLEAAEFFKANDFFNVGQLINQSHCSLRDDYNTSLPQIDELVEYVQKLPGVYGSRITGAGFGGCIVALADTNKKENIRFNVLEFLKKQRIKQPLVEILTDNFQAGVIK